MVQSLEQVRAEMLRLATAAAQATEHHDPDAARQYADELSAYMDQVPTEYHQQLMNSTAREKLSQNVERVLAFVMKRLLA